MRLNPTNSSTTAKTSPGATRALCVLRVGCDGRRTTLGRGATNDAEMRCRWPPPLSRRLIRQSTPGSRPQHIWTHKFWKFWRCAHSSPERCRGSWYPASSNEDIQLAERCRNAPHRGVIRNAGYTTLRQTLQEVAAVEESRHLRLNYLLPLRHISDERAKKGCAPAAGCGTHRLAGNSVALCGGVGSCKCLELIVKSSVHHNSRCCTLFPPTPCSVKKLQVEPAPNLSESGPKLAETSRNLAEVGPSWPTSVRIWSKSARSGGNRITVGRYRRNCCQSRSKCGRCRSTS